MIAGKVLLESFECIIGRTKGTAKGIFNQDWVPLLVKGSGTLVRFQFPA
jgi:hypothetical protein